MCWETTANWMGRLGVQCVLLCAGEGVLDCRLCCPQTHAHTRTVFTGHYQGQNVMFYDAIYSHFLPN